MFEQANQDDMHLRRSSVHPRRCWSAGGMDDTDGSRTKDVVFVIERHGVSNVSRELNGAAGLSGIVLEQYNVPLFLLPLALLLLNPSHSLSISVEYLEFIPCARAQ